MRIRSSLQQNTRFQEIKSTYNKEITIFFSKMLISFFFRNVFVLSRAVREWNFELDLGARQIKKNYKNKKDEKKTDTFF